MSTTLSPPRSAVAGNAFATLGRFGDRPALITADSVMSFDELADRIDEAGRVLTDTRRLVLVAGSNRVEAIVAYLAALAHGHTVLLAPDDNPGGLAALTAAYDPDVVFGAGADRFVQRRSGTRHDLHEDLALLMSTSGSTGSPKLVRLSRTNVESNARAIADYLGIGPGDRAITTLPMHYCYGLSVLNSHLLRGAGLVVTDWSVIDPCLWDLFRRSEATSFAGVPYTFDLLDTIGFVDLDLPSLRHVTQAGGRLAPERVASWARLGRERGWDFFAMYGQTEATARMAYLPPRLAESHPHSLGIAVPGGSLRLEPVPEIAGSAADRGVGELVFEGPNVMMGYAHSPADLARGPERGELRTGDLARADADGMLTWVGRRSRIAKVLGVRICLDDVERTLGGIGVTGWCVSVGDRLHAFVDARDGRQLPAARKAVAASCGLPEHLVDVHRLSERPRTCNGKTDYAALQHHAAVLVDRSARRTRAATPVAGAEDVRDVFAALLGRPDATVEQSFVDLGGDSLSYAELAVQLAERGVDLPRDWHMLPISRLAAAPRGRTCRGVRLDMSILLRAVAILLVVGSHSNVWMLAGGAHILLGVVGYNFSRFHLARTGRTERMRGGLTSLARLAAHSAAWIALVGAVAGTYTLGTAVFLNGVLGSDTWTAQWQFWFLEAIIWIQLGLLAVLAIPAVARFERRDPYAVAVTVAVAALVLRYALVGVEAGPTERYTPSMVLWCFALGWAAATARTQRQRLVVSALVVAGVAGFFGDAQREAIVIAGLLLLVWVQAVTVPRIVARGAGVLAAASLYIYLTHWQIYPHLEMDAPWAALLASIAGGIAYQWVCGAADRRVGRIRRHVRRPPGLTPLQTRGSRA